MPEGTETKMRIIREIKAIYRDLGYRRSGRQLEEFPEAHLRRHLENLQAGALPAGYRGRQKKKSPSPQPSSPEGRGGERTQP